MLFNSYAFLFIFLPIVLAGCYLLANVATRLAAPWLVLASLFFYGWWDAKYVLLLLGSIAFNYGAGIALAKARMRDKARGRWVLVGAVALNIAVLAYFKYAGFLAANASTVLGLEWRVEPLVLPLGISFFTFTQIAFLVDVYRQPVRYGWVHYALFVTYFPHLIAGPILHHREMMPQFDSPASYRLDWDNLAAGVTLFAIGLFKKTVLADGVAPFAAPVFDHAQHGYAPGTFEAWGAALAFGLQLYFDFSAYTDMAVGLSKMFGIRMPANFESPYKATSIIDFWRRWHITLSRFLREYLYIPLGGNRRGVARRYANLMTTMVLGGLWHGAAWTFVIWGAVHGALLSLNHGWRQLRAHVPSGPMWLRRIEQGTGAALTFLAVFAAWVLFRAHDLPSAVVILRGMAGMNGSALPPAWWVEIAESGRAILAMGLPLPAEVASWVQRNVASLDAGIPRGLAEGRHGGVLLSKAQVLWIGALLAIAWFAPNSRQIMARAEPFLTSVSGRAPLMLTWKPSPQWATATAVLLVAALFSMSRVSEFLYFQF